MTIRCFSIVEFHEIRGYAALAATLVPNRALGLVEDKEPTWVNNTK